jgi:hypothetical protein
MHKGGGEGGAYKHQLSYNLVFLTAFCMLLTCISHDEAFKRREHL